MTGVKGHRESGPGILVVDFHSKNINDYRDMGYCDKITWDTGK